MSTLLHEIVNAIDTEIKPMLPKMKSEKDRVEMRRTLMGLEKMVKHIRQELLKESKKLKGDRKEKRLNKLNNIVLEKDNNNNIDTNNAESLQEEQEKNDAEKA